MQGFVLSRPLDPTAFALWFNAREALAEPVANV
jgi:hypothetical protein